MNKAAYSPIVYSPKNLNELYAYSRSHPEASIFAGGTYVLPRFSQLQTGDHNVIDISHVDELQKISRTEGFLEIGAGVTLNRILQIGTRILPANFLKAITTVGNTIVRDQATIGGNMGIRNIVSTLPPLLLLMDVRVEIRRTNLSRWVPLNQVYIPGSGLALENSGFIQRIRIPIREWNFRVFRSQGSFLEDDRFMFAAFATVQKSVITDIRLAYCIGWHTYIRPKEIEVEMEGRKFPLFRGDRENLREKFRELCLKDRTVLKDYQIKQIERTFIWALHELSGLFAE